MGFICGNGDQTNKKNKNNLKPCLKKNYISTIFNIDDDKLKSEKIQIINKTNELEEKLKGNCNIYINEKIIDFSFNSEFISHKI